MIQHDKIRTRYGEKYTISQMATYEHTVFGTVTREQITTRKTEHKPFSGL